MFEQRSFKITAKCHLFEKLARLGIVAVCEHTEREDHERRNESDKQKVRDYEGLTA